MMFINSFASNFSNHRYSLAATGIHFKEKEFGSRQVAEKEMYDFVGKKGLRIVEVWAAHHYKTYRCNDGVRFYINRI